jgi:hypothetical protein
MPKGLYVHRDPADGTLLAYERFSCAPGPVGWRYVARLLTPDGLTAGSVEVVADARWHSVRIDVRAGGWVVRGGDAGTELAWVRSGAAAAGGTTGAHGPGADGPGADGPGGDPPGGGADQAEGFARAQSFTGRSPAFAIVNAHRLALTVGGSGRLRLVALTEPVLAPRTVDEAWTLAERVEYETDLVPLSVAAYEITDLATGERRRLHLAGDVVLAAPGLELEELDGPPTL